MKRTVGLALAVLLALLMLLTACAKSSWNVVNTDNGITLTVENAGKDAEYALGTLQVEEGEVIVLAADLTKGTVRVQVFAADEQGESGEALLTADFRSTEKASGTMPAGQYLLKAVCLEEATGTVRAEARPAA